MAALGASPVWTGQPHCKTEKALIGYIPGDEVEVPTETQSVNRKVKINAIRPAAQWQPA